MQNNPTASLLLALIATALGTVVLPACGSSETDPAGATDSGDQDNASPSEPTAAANAATTPDVRQGWPTEDEAKQAIFKVEYAIHASQTNKDVWHVKDMRHEVHSVRFADRTTEKQMNYGRGAITVYPAKVLYTRITEYSDKEATREELGADGVWFLYQDSFGDWTGKYGSE